MHGVRHLRRNDGVLVSFDAIRAEYPHLGLALYALDPGGPVTLEVHTPDGGVFAWSGATQAAVLAASGLEAAAVVEAAPEPPVAATPVVEDVFG